MADARESSYDEAAIEWYNAARQRDETLRQVTEAREQLSKIGKKAFWTAKQLEPSSNGRQTEHS